MEKIDLDQLEDLRDEMDEMIWESKEINELLNRDYTVDVDEDELDAELKELDDGMFMEMLENKDKAQDKTATQDHYSQILNKNVN